MQNMGIGVLPHMTNALLVTGMFSAGNAYTYCAMRSLYGLALEGQAPAVFKKCTRQGIPYYCFVVVMLFPLLSFLCVSEGSALAVHWLANLTEAAQILDYLIMAVMHLFFFRALKAQGISRDTLPYKGWCQPYAAWAGAIWMGTVVTIYGYTTFLPGHWNTGNFFSYYTMIFVAMGNYAFWKLFKKTKVVAPLDADLVWDKPIIDAYEDGLTTKPEGAFDEFLQMLGLRKVKDEADGSMEERV